MNWCLHANTCMVQSLNEILHHGTLSMVASLKNNCKGDMMNWTVNLIPPALKGKKWVCSSVHLFRKYWNKQINNLQWTQCENYLPKDMPFQWLSPHSSLYILSVSKTNPILENTDGEFRIHATDFRLWGQIKIAKTTLTFIREFVNSTIKLRVIKYFLFWTTGDWYRFEIPVVYLRFWSAIL